MKDMGSCGCYSLPKWIRPNPSELIDFLSIFKFVDFMLIALVHYLIYIIEVANKLLDYGSSD